MTTTEMRDLAARIAAEHGQGWTVAWYMGSVALIPPGNRCRTRVQCNTAYTYEDGEWWVVSPCMEAYSDTEFDLAVTLWPEMQRLCAMLRESLCKK